MCRRPADLRAGGFTLLEMLIVMAVIGILLGIGVGFLQRRGDQLDIAVATVRDQLRVAALTARTRHVPTEVRIDPGDVDHPVSIVASVPEVVGQWHMEAEEAIDDDGGLPTQLTGLPEPGRFGDARRNEVARRTPLLDVGFEGRPSTDLRYGFALRIDVRVETDDAMVVARLGTSLELRLREGLLPEVRLVGTEGGERAGPALTLRGTRPLTTREWHTLAVIHDGRTAELLVDEQQVDGAPMALPLLQSGQDRFQVSPGDAPVAGLVDEVLFEAYDRGTPQTLPFGVTIEASQWVVAFDRNGDLLAPVQLTLALGDERRELSVGPGGIVE